MLGVVPPSCKKPFWRKVPAHEFWGFCLQDRNILKTIRLFLRKIRVFLRKNHLFLHPSFYFSIRPFLCHLDLSRKKRNILRKTWNILRKIRVRTLGEPFVKNPTDLVPLFVRLSKCQKLEIYVSRGLPLV